MVVRKDQRVKDSGQGSVGQATGTAEKTRSRRRKPEEGLVSTWLGQEGGIRPSELRRRHLACWPQVGGKVEARQRWAMCSTSRKYKR